MIYKPSRKRRATGLRDFAACWGSWDRKSIEQEINEFNYSTISSKSSIDRMKQKECNHFKTVE